MELAVVAKPIHFLDEEGRAAAIKCIGPKRFKEALNGSKPKPKPDDYQIFTTKFDELMDNIDERRDEYNAIINSEDSDLVCFIRYNLDGRDICSVLSSPNRDYLIRTDDPSNKVQVSSLMGKKFGLYFSSPRDIGCRKFARILADVYTDLSRKGDFEIVVIPNNGKSFDGIFSKMPWLAVPFYDKEAIKHLGSLFIVWGRPVLVIIDENGHVLTSNGAEIIRDYGAESYPFTRERLKEVKEEREVAKENQSLQSLLVSKSRDFVISNERKEVKIRELAGKFVGLYFSVRSSNFTGKLIELYNKLKTDGASFEIVMISIEYEEEPCGEEFEAVPWLLLPFKDTSRWRLCRYFEVSDVPTLVVIGPDGKTVNSDAVDAVEEYGALAYPFTAERFSELDEIEKAKHEAQTVQSLFIYGDLDFLIRIDGTKVPVSSLAGKHVLLYFSGRSCYSTEKLVGIYERIKREDDAFEMICIFHSADKRSFDRLFSKMPLCLALPFGDKRKHSICSTFKDSLVAFGPTGKFITTETEAFLNLYGPEAYPFTEKRIEEIEEKYAEILEEFPDQLDGCFHSHELVCSPAWDYECDICKKRGEGCSFMCLECDYFFHPKCALMAKEGEDEYKSRMLGMGVVCGDFFVAYPMAQ